MFYIGKKPVYVCLRTTPMVACKGLVQAETADGMEKVPEVFN